MLRLFQNAISTAKVTYNPMRYEYNKDFSDDQPCEHGVCMKCTETVSVVIIWVDVMSNMATH
jgi:hypothetical protein